MDIGSVAHEIPLTPEAKADAPLWEAAGQVEGMFLKILMKEGMQGMLDSASGHSSSALAYALEQVADDVGSAGTLGIADQIYDQLSSNL